MKIRRGACFLLHPLLATTTGRSTLGVAIDATLPAIHCNSAAYRSPAVRATTMPREGP
jgi:hypothetical protein